MDGSNLVIMILPIVIPTVLVLQLALPFIADSSSGRRRPSEPPTCDVLEEHVDAQAPDRDRLAPAPASGPTVSQQLDPLPQATPAESAGSGRSR